MAYQSPFAKALDEEQQLRILIIGAPGAGKTYGSLTFSTGEEGSCAVVNYDKGLGAHVGRKDVVEFPFWSKEFWKNFNPNYQHLAYKKFLETEALKFEAQQVLVNDAWTGVQNAIDDYLKATKVVTKSGHEDTLAFWGRKIEESKAVVKALNALKCNVIVTAHETVERDKEGDLTGKLKPLQQGQFADQLAGYFTDVFRMHGVSMPQTEEVWNKIPLVNYGAKNISHLKEIFQSALDKGKHAVTCRFWQTKTDDVMNCKTCLVDAPARIPARAEEYAKYQRISTAPKQ